MLIEDQARALIGSGIERIAEAPVVATIPLDLENLVGFGAAPPSAARAAAEGPGEPEPMSCGL